MSPTTQLLVVTFALMIFACLLFSWAVRLRSVRREALAKCTALASALSSLASLFLLFLKH